MHRFQLVLALVFFSFCFHLFKQRAEAGWSPVHATGHPINSPPFLPAPLIKPISLFLLCLPKLYIVSATGCRSRVHLSPSISYNFSTMGCPVAAARDGQAPRQLPPGFRFHPTDEELVVQYLRRKALSHPLPAAVIPVVHDVARLDPWDLPGACAFLIRAAMPVCFFCLSGGGRRRRACSGYWMATGKSKPVFLQSSGCGGKRYLVGVKTALTFHRGEPSRAPLSSSRTAWVMHEYRLAEPAEQRKLATNGCAAVHPGPGEWVVCRIFLKNNGARRPNRRDTAGETPGNLASSAAPQRLLLSSSPQASSSSCVTGVTEISDQDEVSSGSSIRDTPSAVSQREA